MSRLPKYLWFLTISFVVVCTLALMLYQRTSIRAQSQGTQVQCGSIINGQFTQGNTKQYYYLTLQPGDTLSVSARGVGAYVDFGLQIYSPSQAQVSQWNTGNSFDVSTAALSESGIYTIYATSELNLGTNYGNYTLYIGCVSGGQVIKPGAIINPTPTVSQSTSTATFSGVGFPGLDAVDFSNVSSSQLPSDGKIEGQIKPTSKQSIVFTFNAKANNNASLDFVRETGNLNLGIVILSPDNKVIFQVSLVTSQTFSTQFSLPSAGQYIIGIFPIDLMPPANTPIATSFQATFKIG